MPSFGTVALPDINPLLDLASVDKNINTINSGRLANQLASNTLDSNTQIAANTAESGGLANQLATQKNPLEIASLRQQLGLDPSPTLDKLRDIYNGGSGQPAAGRGLGQPVSGSFTDQMGASEAPNASAVNAGGYSGQFQFGAARLADSGVGAYTPAPGENLNANTWQGTFNIPGFPDVKTHAQFLASPDAQRAVFATHVADIDSAIAQTPGADKLNQNGLRAVAHLGGVAGMQKFVETGGAYNPGDNPNAPGGGTHLSDYYAKFSQGGPAALQAAFGHPDGPPAPAAQPAPVASVTNSQNSPVVAGALANAAAHPDGIMPGPGMTPNPQYATRGPMPGDTATDASATAPPAIPAAPVGTQDADTVLAQLRASQGAPAAPPPIENPNALLPADGPAPAAPQNQLMPAASAAPPTDPVPQNQLMPPAAATPPAPAVQPGTGMQSPQVQAAQALLRRATQVELAAAATPNDPRVKAAAAAMATDLRSRAAVIMQADSVTVDPNTGLQTHTLTGKVDNAATPAMNYQPDPNNPGVLVSPGQKPVVLPPGRATTLPDGSTWVTGPGGTFKEARGPDLEGASAAAAAAAGGKAAADSAAKTKDALIPLARTSVQAISNIDYGLHQLDEAAKGGIPTGYFAPALATAAGAAKSLGIKIPGVDPSAVSNIQTASKTLAVVSGAILQNILGPKAEITEGKIEAFIHAQPGIVNDPLATHRILNWARSQFVYDHEMAMDGLSHVDPKSGQLSPGWQAGYITTHGSGPIYDPASGEMKQPDGQAPSREPPPEPAPPKPTPAPAIPPLAERVAGQAYSTPKGMMNWTGTGWLPAGQ